MLSLASDLKLGVRLLMKTPGFTLIALLALALGMGATTAIFSVVDAVLLRPLPYRDPERLLVVWEKNPAQGKYRLFTAGTNFRQWQQRSHTLEGMAAVQEQMAVAVENLATGGRVREVELIGRQGQAVDEHGVVTGNHLHAIAQLVADGQAQFAKK